MDIPSAEHGPDMCCPVEPLHKPVTPSDLAQAHTAYLLVSGMGCPVCAVRVHNALLSLEGVLAVTVRLQWGVAQVLYDATQISPECFPPAVANADPTGRHRYTARLLE